MFDPGWIPVRSISKRIRNSDTPGLVQTDLGDADGHLPARLHPDIYHDSTGTDRHGKYQDDEDEA